MDSRSLQAYAVPCGARQRQSLTPMDGSGSISSFLHMAIHTVRYEWFLLFFLRSDHSFRTFVISGMFLEPYDPAHLPHDLLEPVASLLLTSLTDMPRLQNVRVQHNWLYGIPLCIMQVILSVPQLKGLEITELLDRKEPIPEGLRLAIPPLQRFHYINYRVPPRKTPMETALLTSVVTQASASLRTLSISSEPAPPLDTFSQYQWPHLREFRVKGERTYSASATAISLFAGMHSLHTLVLELALPVGLGRQLLWPKATNVTAFPWPNLRTLLVTYPHPDDEIYSRLPATLCSLSLRCWPRHYIMRELPAEALEYVLKWHSPILTSSELLSIVRRGQSDHIVDLDIEYEQDEREEELLFFLPLAYPNLTKLTLHRYRFPEKGDIDIVSDPLLAMVFFPFTHLRVATCRR